jgi:hypothetical protein
MKLHDTVDWNRYLQVMRNCRRKTFSENDEMEFCDPIPGYVFEIELQWMKDR